MISSLGQKFTLRQIWDWWTVLPSICKSKTKGSNITRGNRSQNRLKDYLEVREKTDKLLEDAGVEPPTSIADYRSTIRKVGALLTARTILSRTPVVVLQLPTQAGHDSKSAMRDRVVCDERITLSKEDFKGAPLVWDKLGYLTDKELLHVQMFYRCNTKIWWLAERKDPKDLEGILVKLRVAEAPEGHGTSGPSLTELRDNFTTTGQVSLDPALGSEQNIGEAQPLIDQGLLPPPKAEFAMSTVGNSYRKQKKLGPNWFWFSCECGLVMSATSSWEIPSKEKGVTCGGYMCKRCQGFWRASNGGTRTVQISANRERIQLILDEPPDGAFNEWARSRIAFYQRVEPNAPPRDTSPPKMANYRIRFTGAASDAVWLVVLSNPEAPALAAISGLAAQHVQRQLQSLA